MMMLFNAFLLQQSSTKNRSLPVLFVTAILLAAAKTEPTMAASCECKSVADSFLVTRLWNIIDESWTDQMVIDEFDNGFAPEVTALPGFQEYASATTGNDDLVFFMNIFETREDAKAAQEGAKDFVRKGVLNGVITPNQFHETELAFQMIPNDCNTESFKDQFMGTQIYSLTGEAALAGNWTIGLVAQEMESGLAPILVADATTGFLEYGGASVTDTDFIFFYHVFDSLQGVQEFHTVTEDYVSNHPQLSTVIQKIVFTEGQVGFDYTCAADNLPAIAVDGDGDADGSLESSATASARRNILTGSAGLLLNALLLH